MSDANNPWLRLEDWLITQPSDSRVEVESTQHGTRWGVRLIQFCEPNEEYILGERVVADAESATLAGAVEGAMLLEREFREGA